MVGLVIETLSFSVLIVALVMRRVSGHNIYYESQVLSCPQEPLLAINSSQDVPLSHCCIEPNPTDATERDSSFDVPFRMGQPTPPQISRGHLPLSSQAINMFLDECDYDVVSFTISNDDNGLVVAQPLVPACHETRRNFPSLALVGNLASLTAAVLTPIVPATESELMDLPWYDDLVAHYSSDLGAIITTNPRCSPTPSCRELFTAEQALTGVSWYLPEGLNEDCLPNELGGPGSCDFTNSIVAIVPPGDYFLVVWDPRGKAQYITLNIGFDETDTAADCSPDTFECQGDATDLIRNHAWMARKGCTPVHDLSPTCTV
ncbi:unnamed protein product [Choristocarpus tenellus]